jgi:hypothetical protein
MPQMRRLFVSLAVGLFLAATALPGVAGAGSPPASGVIVRFDEIVLVAYEDPTDELVALTGPPAELGCLGLGFEDYFSRVQAATTPSGAIVVTARVDEVPVYVYRSSSIADICDAVVANESPGLLARGAVRFTHTDNDFLVSETRMNAFGDSATGIVVDETGGKWAFAAVFRSLVEPSEGDDCACRIVKQDITLRQLGD